MQNWLLLFFFLHAFNLPWLADALNFQMERVAFIVSAVLLGS
jgi:hypothetical protein